MCVMLSAVLEKQQDCIRNEQHERSLSLAHNNRIKYGLVEWGCVVFDSTMCDFAAPTAIRRSGLSSVSR